ncbi:hypothetical protein K2173_002814 [Erythroxylum novogranatense]|uniref:RNA-directed DNA polymerase n=1 Tax=Erythroxylum novogranatense TaxID=1862640 RepID=A0AAV8SQA3_9ROSI|nr:hypothetical protein K2173_002814 [Erythroxylum novogranatense]
MDQRVEQLEQTVQSLSGGQEGIAKRLEELFSQLNVRMDQPVTQSSQEKHTEPAPRTPDSRIRSNDSVATSSYASKMVKLDFPRFDEKEDATSWICRAEQFFQFHCTPDEDRVGIASFHMVGDAQLWYQLLKQENPAVTWAAFKDGFYARYGPNQLIDFFGELSKLQQQVGRLVQDRQVSCFVSGLTPLIRTDVQANRPKTLAEAIAFARLYEARNTASGKGLPTQTRLASQMVRSPSRPASGFVKRLTWDELNERKRLELCFKCNDKFGPGHKCKKLFSIQAVLEDSDDDIEMEIEDQDSAEEVPAISLHAIAGFEGPKTMRLCGRVVRLDGMVLVDSGSTHNFISEEFTRKAGLEPTKRKKLKVQVASGEELSSPGIFPIIVDLYILPLEGYDVVLGTQWLRTLVLTVWDFSKLLMAFNLNGMQSDSTTPQISNLHPQIRDLLNKFSMTITEPARLPPQRSHDHKIPLKNPEPISVRPYRYPHYQKTEIERIVAEMLATGIIQPIQSPYSAPVLLKCQFGTREVKYLGHVISNGGVSVDPYKIDSIRSWPKPTTPKALRGFLGLCGYCRKFIQHFGRIAGPLTRMLKKDGFNWSPMAETAFASLKEAMTKASVLALPDFSKQFIRPIAFFSQALHGKHLLLSTYEKEMLALVIAVQKWRSYLLGQTFVVKTDHQSLKHLWTQRITTAAQQKWLFKLMGFDLVIKYKGGKENVVADALSRRDEQEDREGEISAISCPIPNWVDSIKEEVQSLPDLQEKVKQVQEGEAIGPWEY